MIRTPTVLVLGAGASKPYGYPLGRELVNTIVKNVLNFDSDLSKELDHVPRVIWRRFGEALKASASPSIDAFLESRPDFIDIGRYAIAFELLRCEKPEIFYEKDDWYHYLYDKMRDPNRFESFGESKISIITFNYDRSLEFFLYTALKHSFQENFGELVQNFRKIPIIHVHGQLGQSPTFEGFFPYGTPIQPSDRPILGKHIKITAKSLG
jgi:hypothetical protein